LRTLIHLSDLHFGRIHDDLVQPLTAAIRRLSPDLIAVSGDLTQRARKRQFQEARKFLDSLSFPKIIVPGNHDVPLYDFIGRFVRGLVKYRRYITEDLEPFYSDSEIAVLGINTARSLTFKGGRINEQQVTRIQERLCKVGDRVTKIIVSHHPFELPEQYRASPAVGRARMALERLADCGVDLFLAGHFHIGFAGHRGIRLNVGGYCSLIVQAGTAISSRSRGEPNSFNVIRIARPEISVERFNWLPSRKAFIGSVTDYFRQTGSGWTRIEKTVISQRKAQRSERQESPGRGKRQ
jgi:3',5'-cyclic AMP phosphodiesterase CpdA